MSMYDTKSVVCPKCGAENTAKIWRSINADINPEMRIEILNGTAFLLTCVNCDYRPELIYPCLYHDMQNAFFIYLLQNPEEDEAMLAEMQADAKIMEGYRHRVVTTSQRLIEKIKIFEAGLDDRHIELYKIFFRVAAKLTEKTIQLYFDTGDDGHKIVVLNDGATKSAKVSDDMLTKTKAIIDPIPQETKGAFQLIDQAWAMDLISKRNALK